MDRIDFGNSPEGTDMDMGVKEKKANIKILHLLEKIDPKKIVILFIALGVLCMTFSLPRSNKTTVETMSLEEEIQTTDSLETRMADILSCVSGAGEVRVMLTVKDNGETEFQTNTEEYQSGEQWETKTETVFANDRSMPVVRKQSEPTFLGALVLCQGAEDAKVRYDITSAVCRLTGLGSDKIAVLKMGN